MSSRIGSLRDRESDQTNAKPQCIRALNHGTSIYFKQDELVSVLHLTGQPTTNAIPKPTKTHPAGRRPSTYNLHPKKKHICVLVFPTLMNFFPQICNLQILTTTTTTPSHLPLPISFWGRKQGSKEAEHLQERLGWLPWLAIPPFSRLQLVHLQNEKHQN